MGYCVKYRRIYIQGAIHIVFNELHMQEYFDRKQVTSMPEHQTIEWKESWHDEFLEWICG